MGVIFNWSELRVVGGSLPARVSILFPIVANLAIFNDNFAAQFSGEEVIFKSIPALNGALEIYLFYTFLGLCFFAAAEIAYLFYCPALIKRHPDTESFLLSLSDSVLSRSILLRWANYADQSPHVSDEEKSFEGVASAILAIEGSEFDFNKMGEKIVNVASFYYKCMSLDWPIARVFCTFFFFIGLALIYLPSFKTILKAGSVLFL